MGLIGGILNTIFGPQGNVVRETAEVFRENAEAASSRDHALQVAAMEAFAAEFAHARRGGFDRFMDGLNRVPRPALALSTLGLFAAAMANPIWFASRMEGMALVPEPLWWLMGAIVSFYFGARHQMKGQAFQSSIAKTLSRAQEMRAASELPSLTLGASQSADASRELAAPLVGSIEASGIGLADVSRNAALREWLETRDGQ